MGCIRDSNDEFKSKRIKCHIPKKINLLKMYLHVNSVLMCIAFT